LTGPGLFGYDITRCRQVKYPIEIPGCFSGKTLCKEAGVAIHRRADTSGTAGKVGVYLGLILFIAGCASTGKTIVTKKLSRPLDGYKSVAVAVASQFGESQDIELMLEGKIIQKLREIDSLDSVFSYRLAPHEPHDLRVTVTVTDMVRVSPVERDLLGALAGSGKVVISTVLTDTRSNETISKFFVKGTATWRSSTPQAVRRIAEEIKAYFVQNLLGS
jgi:hypothetical protein